MVGKQYLHHNVPHVVKLLRVQEGSEFLSCGDTIAVPVSHLEAPLVTGKHGLVGGLVIHVIKLLVWKDSVNNGKYSLQCPCCSKHACNMGENNICYLMNDK